MVSHYRITAKIGSGGMGEVYLADDTKLNRRVALKFLPSHLAADSILRARFTREVQAVAALNHPNIVHVYEVSEFNRRPFFAMEYVEGEPLRERMRPGKMPLDQAIECISGLCEGLEAAHKVGIVHRDIKPANIVVANSGRIKILDFGLAKRASDPTLTSMGSTLGTICYMSPEQVQGRESDNRSDLFSVGIVLYEMVAGRLPFRGDYDAATLTAIVSEPHEPLSKFRPDAPTRLTAMVDRLLAKDPAKRYPTVTEVLADLSLLRDEIKFGERAAAAKLEPAAKKPFPTLLVAAIGTAVVAIGIIAVLLSTRSDSPETGQSRPLETATAPSTLPQQDEADPQSGQPIEQGDPAVIEAEPPPPVVDRSAYISDSIASATESARLQALRDSIERERIRLQEANLAARQPDTTTRSGDGRWERATPPQASVQPPTPPKREPAIDRPADSTTIHSVLSRFWQNLESGRIGELRNTYPSMPRDWEANWKTFVDYAKDLKVNSSVGRLRFDGDKAEANNQVQMSFRDHGGSKTQNVRYSAHLTRQDNTWIIEKLVQN